MRPKPLMPMLMDMVEIRFDFDGLELKE